MNRPNGADRGDQLPQPTEGSRTYTVTMKLLAALLIATISAPAWAAEPVEIDPELAFTQDMIKGQRDIFARLSRLYPHSDFSASGQRRGSALRRDMMRAQTRLLGHAAGSALRAAYRNNGLKDTADRFLADPRSAGAAEWGAAALVGTSIAVVSGLHAEAKIASAKLRLHLASGIKIQNEDRSTELGGAELAMGPISIEAAIGRRDGRLETSRVALNYSLRY